MKMEQSVPKRRQTKFRRRGITQKKAYKKGAVLEIILLGRVQGYFFPLLTYLLHEADSFL